MTAMNPYAFRGWHLPSYPDGASNYERYNHMYGSLPSGYFAPSSMYPFNTENHNQKQHNGEWKLPSSSVCSTSSDGSPNTLRDQAIPKTHYDSLYKPNTCRNADCDDLQRSSCALSCTCNSPQQRLSVLNNSWGADLGGALDFNKTSMTMSSMSQYQSICNRGK